MDVYFCHIRNEPIVNLKPVYKWFIEENNKKNIKSTGLLQCPAFRDELFNTFIIESNFYYTLTWDGQNLTSDCYNQDIFNKFIRVRSFDMGLFSIEFPKFIFLSEESLDMSVGPAFLHNNNFVNQVNFIPGVFNIGKHARSIETAFLFKQKSKITINENDALMYVKFHSKQKINLKPFFYNNEIKELVTSSINLRSTFKFAKPLEWWYDLNHVSKRMRKIINLAKKNCFL